MDIFNSFKLTPGDIPDSPLANLICVKFASVLEIAALKLIFFKLIYYYPLNVPSDRGNRQPSPFVATSSQLL